MDGLEGLIARVEASAGADRELDAQIGELVGHKAMDAFGFWREPPHYTASLDAAMSLVPEGWHVQELGESEDDNPWPEKRQYTGKWFVRLHNMTTGLMHNLCSGLAATPALALTAAALRARLRQGEGGRG